MAKKFLTDINIAGGVYDSSGDIGNSGQVLSSTGSGVNWINATSSASIVYQDGFTGDGSTTAFTLANSIDNENKTQVYIDGVYQHKDNYSLNGTTLTFSTAPPNTADIEVISFSSVSAADDILYDDDFTSAGLMTTNGSGVYSITTNNSSNWNTAYTYSQVGHLPLSGGAITGAITTNSTFDGRDISVDGTKLDGIEANATADQTDAEIRAAVEAAADSNVFTDADHSKLNGIEASADVTDTANVTAAGALMDSEVTNLADVKAFDTTDYATAAQGVKADSAQQPPSEGAFVNGDKTKLDGIAAGAEVNVQSDWNSTSGDSLILNKPSIPSITGLASETYVDTAVSNLVDSAPGTLDTLNELAAALGDDANFSTTVTNSIATKLPLAGGALTGTLTINNPASDKKIAFRRTGGKSISIEHDTSQIYFYNETDSSVLFTIANNANLTTTGSISVSGGNSTQWNTAYGWGNHASAGYLASSSYTAADVLSKILTVDGSSSGLDADLLDGVDSASFVRSDADDTLSGQYTFTKTNDHAIKVGTIRGTAVGSQTGQFIQMYERVNIGGPSGWGASNTATPSYGLSTYGGTRLAVYTDYTESGGSMRAPIFYDSNNTGYYVSPANGANGISANLQGRIQVGTFNNSQANTGEAWIGRASDRAQGTLTVQLGTGTGRKFEVVDYNWTTVEFSANDSGTAFAAGDFRAPIFYDSNDTGYYLNPASGSIINNIDINGGASYPLQVSSSQRYIIQARNTGNSTNVNYGWWWYTDTDFDMGFHADGAGDRMNLTRDGSLSSTGDMRAPIFYDSNNTAYATDPASTSILNYTQIYNLYDAQGTRFTSPEGASHFTSASTQTGMIRIKLPANRRRSNTMMQMTVNVYQYTTGKSFTIRLGGYNYSGGSWYNEFAHMITDSGMTPLNVRFGDDGTHDWICIGETNSTWAYCQVMITDFQGGYSGTTNAWGYGWAIDFVTSLPSGHTNTRATSLALTSNNVTNWTSNLYAPIYYDSNDTNYYVDPNSTSQFSGGLAIGTTSWDTTNFKLDVQGGVSLRGGFYMGVSNNNLNSWQGRIFNSGSGQYWSGQAWYFNGSGWGGGNYWTLDNSGNSIAAGSHRAPIFYDSNNTAYYVDPASTSNVSIVNADGSCNFTASTYPMFVYGNGSTAGSSAVGLQVYSTGNNGAIMAFHRGGYYAVNMGLDSDNVFRIGGWSASSNRWTLDMSGNSVAASSHRAPIFYDSGNTAYYVDPLGGSNLAANVLITSGKLKVSTASLTYGTGYNFHNIENTNSNEPICVFYHSVGTTAVQFYGLNVISAAAHNNTTSRFFLGQGGGTERIKIYSNGNIQNSNNSYGQLSDINLKENIVDATSKLDEINQIRVVNFNYIGDIDEETNTPNKQIGVIAQEVEQIFPGLVYECGDTETTTKAVKYSVFVPMMLKAIQELKADNDSLKARIETLENN